MQQAREGGGNLALDRANHLGRSRLLDIWPYFGSAAFLASLVCKVSLRVLDNIVISPKIHLYIHFQYSTIHLNDHQKRCNVTR